MYDQHASKVPNLLKQLANSWYVSALDAFKI